VIIDISLHRSIYPNFHSTTTMKFLAGAMLALPLALAKPIAKRDGSSGVEGSTPFVGTGKIGMYHDDDGVYMGCLTVDGQWTIDESQCAVFTGTTDDSSATGPIHLTTDAGTCGTWNTDGKFGVAFSCGLGKDTSYYVRLPNPPRQIED
jgi:hypothetical protein